MQQPTPAELLQQLIKQMSSHDMGETWNAVSKLHDYGWLYDGSLRGANLCTANLYEAFMPDANLSEVDLSDANLEGADLTNVLCTRAKFIRANMAGIALISADFQHTIFDEANLHRAYLGGNAKGASFKKSNLEEASLAGNFQSVNLEGANLQGVKLSEVIFDETSILPDGTKWSLSTDMSHFTG